MSEPFVRVGGPEKHGKRWRVAKITATGRREHEYFVDSEEDGPGEIQARAFVVEFRERVGKRSVTIGGAVKEYLEHLEKHGGSKGRPLKANTLRIVRSKLEGILALVDPALRRGNRGKRRPVTLKIIDRTMGDLTPNYARRLYETRVVSGVTPDTHRSELIYANAFGVWCVTRGFTKVNPFAEVLPQGSLSTGKATLTVDEAQRFYDVAMADPHPLHGFACAAILLLGVRVSELIERTVRDLDVGGTVLRLPIGMVKTKASARNLVIPEALRPRFGQLALAASNGLLVKGQSGPTARLFGTTKSGTILKKVEALCIRAGVPVVCTHGLRGSAISNAIEMGHSIKSASVAAGHENTVVTNNHYVRPGVAESARARDAETLIVGNRAFPVVVKEQVELGTEADSQFPMPPQGDLTN